MLHHDDIRNAENWNPHVKKSSAQGQPVRDKSEKATKINTVKTDNPSGENVPPQGISGVIRNSNVPHVSDLELPENTGDLKVLYEQPVEKNNIRPLNTDVIEFSQPGSCLSDKPVTKKRKRRKKSRWKFVLFGLLISTVSGVLVFLWLIHSENREFMAYQTASSNASEATAESDPSDIQAINESFIPSHDNADEENIIDTEEYADSYAEGLDEREEPDDMEDYYESGIAADEYLVISDDTLESVAGSEQEWDIPEYEDVDASPGADTEYEAGSAEENYEPDINDTMEGNGASAMAEEPSFIDISPPASPESDSLEVHNEPVIEQPGIEREAVQDKPLSRYLEDKEYNDEGRGEEARGIENRELPAEPAVSETKEEKEEVDNSIQEGTQFPDSIMPTEPLHDGDVSFTETTVPDESAAQPTEGIEIEVSPIGEGKGSESEKEEVPDHLDSAEIDEPETGSGIMRDNNPETTELSTAKTVGTLIEDVQAVSSSDPFVNELTEASEHAEKKSFEKAASTDNEKGNKKKEQIAEINTTKATIQPFMISDVQAHQKRISPSLKEMSVNYEEQFNTAESQWPLFQESTASGWIEGGAYNLQNTSHQGSHIVLYSYGTPADMDFMMHVSLNSARGSGDNSYGFVFGAQDSENNYSFQILNNHMYSIEKILDGNKVELAAGQIDNIFSSSTHQKSFKIAKQKNTVRFYVDGHYIDKIYNAEFPGDKVGFLLKGEVLLSIDNIQTQIRFKNN